MGQARIIGNMKLVAGHDRKFEPGPYSSLILQWVNVDTLAQLRQDAGSTFSTTSLVLIYTVSMPTLTTTEYMKLSVSERIQLVEDIWDSIAAEAPDTVGLSQAQKAELHRRVAEHRADPSTAVPWEQVRAKLFPDKT